MDWIVVSVGLVGFILAGRKIWWSWYVNLVCQVLWVIYGYTTGQYAFIFSAAVYSVVFAGNAVKWTNDHFAEKKQEEEVDRNSAYVKAHNHGVPSTNDVRSFLPKLKEETTEEHRISAAVSPVWISDSDLVERPQTITHLMEEIRRQAFAQRRNYEAWLEVKEDGRFVHWKFVGDELNFDGFVWNPDSDVRAKQSLLERLNGSDQGPVFFSFNELDAGSRHDLTELQESLERRALELGCSVKIRMETQATGVLVHWEWVK